ncbi:MAG: transporter [Rhizobiales bacterium]|nr:transporter [Hyphomicrobiales bacterium]
MLSRAGILALVATSVLSVPAWAQSVREPIVGDDAAKESDTELAKKIQNPVGDLISLPFQYNANFGYGPNKGTQSVLNIQPVVPLHLNEDWNVITRTILPVVWNPDMAPQASATSGTAPTSFTAFLSPSRDTNGWLWGAGIVVQAPTVSNVALGSTVWGSGPSAVLVYSGGPWVAGALVNNIWSFGGTGGASGTSYSTFLANPFVSYNFDDGWYAFSSPNVTANWKLDGQKWTVPVGGGAGRVFHIGSQPVDISLSAYYNMVKPQDGADWQLSSQLTLAF